MQPQQAPVLPAGKRKALYIGINYVGTKNALRGCHEDVKNVKAFMDSQAQWESTVLVDTPQNQSTPYYPTRQNILNAMHWLVASAQPGDRLFFHYSGHGGQKADQDGDEADGFDETIFPVDHERAGMIIDDEMHRIMCQSLPQGAYLFAIFDCCHSGTILDLPFTYVLDKNDQVVEVDNRKEAGKALLQAALSFARNDKMGALQSAMTAGKFIMNEINNPGGQNQQQQQQIQGEGLKTNGNKVTRGTIVSLTGCRDDQTSADAFIQGRNTGAMSWAFMEAVRRLPQPTYVQLLREIRVLLYGKYEQVPQLSAGFHMDLNTRFIL
ncbi:Ca(2+)-dependent cysteine protease [Rhizoclosmatium sp. JEL0117]|nr:Ca(2+)-dependent cysteine protease [Rhizoclosmatium sp. JEL0117]